MTVSSGYVKAAKQCIPLAEEKIAHDAFTHTKLAPMNKLTRALKARLANIATCCTYGITNGLADGINSKIMSIKHRAGGYRNIENFKKAIFYYCGGLDLYPR